MARRLCAVHGCFCGLWFTAGYLLSQGALQVESRRSMVATCTELHRRFLQYIRCFQDVLGLLSVLGLSVLRC